jgi:hypothetical protein
MHVGASKRAPVVSETLRSCRAEKVGLLINRAIYNVNRGDAISTKA